MSRKFVKKKAIEVLGEEKFRKEFPAYEKIPDEKKRAIIEDIRSKNHGSLRRIARDHKIGRGSVKRIAIEELGEEKFRKEFPAYEKVPDEKKGAIIEDIRFKNYGSLRSIARDYKIAKGSVKKIVIEELGEEKFRKEFPAHEEVSDEKRKAIIKDVKSENHGTLKNIARDHEAGIGNVRNIAFEELGEEKFKKEFPAYYKMPNEKRRAIAKDIKSENHGSLKRIALDNEVSDSAVKKIAIEELGEEKFKKEFPAHEKVPDEKRKAIIKDVKSEYHGSVDNIARDHEVGMQTVKRIVIEELGDDKYRKEFPSYVPARIGAITHECINELIMKDFDERRKNSPDVPKIYSEPRIFHPTSQRHADMGFLNDTSYLKDILTDPISGKILSQELKIDQKKLDQIKFVQFDYTNQLNMDNIMDKIQKYQHPEIMTFIVGTKWSKHWEGRTMDLPVDDRIKYPENIKIINDECFADLMKMKGNCKDKFEEIIDLNKKGDLHALNEILEKDNQTLHNTNELKEDLIKKEYIKRDFSEYINDIKIDKQSEGTLDQFIYNENNIKEEKKDKEFKGVFDEIMKQKENKEFEGVLVDIKDEKKDNEFKGVFDEIMKQKENKEFEGVLDELKEEKEEFINGELSDDFSDEGEEDKNEKASDVNIKEKEEDNGEDKTDGNYENY